MSTLYTIGEVSKITGIKKRTLKYYVERKMIQPTSKKIEGGKESWLYSELDIRKIRQIALYRELGYSADEIKDMIQTPGFEWEEVLDKQIEELKDRKKHIENIILAAELIRSINKAENQNIEFDIADFDNNIDQFVVKTFQEDANERTIHDIQKMSAELVGRENTTDIQKNMSDIFTGIRRYAEAMKYAPDSEEVQSVLKDFLQQYSCGDEKGLEGVNSILFTVRILGCISVERVIDVFFAREGSLKHLSEAIQIYCDRVRREIEVG